MNVPTIKSYQYLFKKKKISWRKCKLLDYNLQIKSSFASFSTFFFLIKFSIILYSFPNK